MAESKLYLGIDIGSLSANAVLINQKGEKRLSVIEKLTDDYKAKEYILD